ncbi:MAG: hypothetical protein LH624_00975 [Cryobacterium sp.]|nr:hypothetical protein [Cryobacterium sp.]
MTMRLFLFLLLVLAGANAKAQSKADQRAPHCGSTDDPSVQSYQVNEIFVLLTDEFWASERASAGMTLTEATAPRGVLNDNDACVHLVQALKDAIGKDSYELGDKYELSFYHVGDYHAVFSRLRIPAGTEPEVRQRHPMHIFTKEKKPRLLMTVYM